MLYVIYAEDIADSLEKRLSVRPAHLARLQLLHDEGRLLTAGPMPAVDSNEPGAAGWLHYMATKNPSSKGTY
ncbi:YciI family protein, partial [Klebsiella pneumoniae]